MQKSYSQPITRQDVWVVDRLNSKPNGTFVEVGAHDGIRHSNTLLLEECYGWEGILIEPNPELFEKCKANRPKALVSDAVINEGCEDVYFLYGDAYGGIEHHMPDDWRAEHTARKTRGAWHYSTTLTKLLEVNFCHRRINYLSLDTEGSELAILTQMMRDEEFEFDIITAEFRYDKLLLSNLEEVLSDKYNLEKVEHFDAFFVHKDLA